ncbi:MAG: IS110 family transposase [Burkholderiaceae bacterium]|nr:MAG: IS110 family transposase [Burkholderiaceae bacterium]TAM03745.1 MAG: IS110 family transposase [Pusillimonas sp.]
MPLFTRAGGRSSCSSNNGMVAPSRNGINAPKWRSIYSLEKKGATVMKITTIGIDLAKNVFQIHGADARGRAVLRQQLKRAQMLPFFARLEPCKVAIDACGSAHYGARKLQALGFEVMLIAPQYVKPYVKRNKNDVADAEAICEAATRPGMLTVPVKTASQQAILSVHRARQGFVKARTAQANQIRGLLAEFGFTIPQGISHLAKCVPEIIEDGENDLPGNFRLLIARLTEHLKVLDGQVAELEAEITRRRERTGLCTRPRKTTTRRCLGWGCETYRCFASATP